MARGGLTLTVAAAAAYSTSGTFGSALLAADWSPAAAVIVRIGIAGLALTIPAILAMRGRWGVLLGGRDGRDGPWRMMRSEAVRLVMYGLVAVAGCQFCYFNALNHLPVSVALLCEYLSAVLVVGWMWLRHGQRPGRLTAAGGAVALSGLVMMIGLSGAGQISTVGVAWGLVTAVCCAVYMVMSAADSDLPPIVTAWGGMCTGAVALYLLGVAGVLRLRASFTDVTLLNHRVTWLVPVLGVSLIAGAFAYVAGIAGAQRLGARVASFASMPEVMFATLFAWIFLGQLPTPLQFAGGALIFVGIVGVRLGERTVTPEPQPEPVVVERGTVRT
jgi:drug/metabolite transporter (DMT)-like permease